MCEGRQNGVHLLPTLKTLMLAAQRLQLNSRAVHHEQFTIDCSVLPLQMRCRTEFWDNAIAVQVRSDCLSHRVFTKQAPDHSGGCYNEVEDHTQNNSGVDPTHDVP